ncbi:MAG: hypothetical protein JNJ49_16720 [Bdellovibrionaceae bacterium]|nr:hypothetical protein [Pseudobdellovibrionaceae bacterium]
MQKRLEEILKLTKRISLQNAVEVLREIRAAKVSSGLGSAGHPGAPSASSMLQSSL